MFKDLWIVYLSDPDFFIPCMFVLAGISVLLKLLYWSTKKPWIVWLFEQLNDTIMTWIFVCCFVQRQIWHICNPELDMALWGMTPYTLFLCFYIFRHKKENQNNVFENVLDCELEHVHRKLGDLINAMRYVPAEQKLYWELIRFQDQLLDEEMRRV